MNDTDNDNLHYTALELAEIKSEQVLATDANKKAETEATAERTIVFVASDNSKDRAQYLQTRVFGFGLCWSASAHDAALVRYSFVIARCGFDDDCNDTRP